MRLYSSSRRASQRLNSIRIPAKTAVRLLTTLFAFFLICLFPSAAVGQQNAPSPQIYELPTSGPPTTFVNLQGFHFDPLTAIDVYFDSTHLASTTTDKNGSFGNGIITATGPTWTRLQVPSTALPGQHTITAKERVGQPSAQIAFLVRTDWPQLNFDPPHTGLNPYENVLSPATVGNLTLDWKYTMQDSLVGSSPVVANGVVYIGSYTNNNNSGELYALNAITGALVWKYTPGGGIVSSPAVANGVVYFGAWDQNVYALNASTGALIWKYRTGGVVDASPAVADGVVYIADFDALSVYALNALTGALIWKYTEPNFTPSSPAVANGVVYVGSNDGNLYALNASTGAFLWRYTTNGGPGTSPGSPAVANGFVYFGSGDGFLYALNASTGAPLWVEYWTDYWDVNYCSVPAVANGVVYISCHSKYDGNILYALDAATGGYRWEVGSWYGFNPPAVANGVVYFGSGDSSLYALNAISGALLWKDATGEQLGSPTAVVNGMVYVGSVYGTLYAFGLPDQEKSEKFSPPERPDPARLTPDWNLQPSSQVTPPLKK